MLPVSEQFVGREKERERLSDALRHALAGEGRMVMLAGEPGCGKTRTAEELVRHVRSLGAEPLWGGCYEGEGAPLYWPWAQVMREWAADHSPEELRRLLGPRASVIAGVIPQLGERLGDLPPPPPLDDPVSARFRFFDAVSTFLRDASAREPVVIVLDDLHWADGPTLLLLEFLAHQLRSMRLLVLGTYRDVELGRMHPLGRTLGDLTRERLFERVALRGLGAEEVQRYIEAVFGAAVPRKLAEEVHERTEGNPLFVTEVVRLLIDEGELAPGRSPLQAASGMRVPEGVREAIGRRLERLSARCNEVLRAAALVGRQFATGVLQRVVEGIGTEELGDLMEQATGARVVEAVPKAPGQCRFTHALVQQTLADEVPLAKQVRLHARIVEALEERYGEKAVREHAEELAEHCAQAEPVLGSGKLAKYLLAAGERALERYANEEALEYFRRGVEAKGPGELDAEGADLWRGLGRAQAAMLDDGSSASFLKAFEYYEKTGQMGKAVEVATDLLFWPPESQPDLLVKLCERALALVEHDSLAEAQVLVKLAIAAFELDSDYAASCHRFERALAIAQREGDAALEMRTWAFWSWIETFRMMHFPLALEKAEKAYQLAEGIDDPRAQALVLSVQISSMENWGASAAAVEPYVTRLVQIAERLHERGWLANAYWYKEKLALGRGQWDEARRLQDLILALNPRWHIPLLHRYFVEMETGNQEPAEEFLEKAIAFTLSMPKGSFDRANMAQHLGNYMCRTGVVRQRYLQLSESLAQETLQMPSVPRGTSLLAEFANWYLAIIRADAEAAAGFCARAEEILGEGRWKHPDSLILLPLLERTAGRIHQAVEHFRNAVEQNQSQDSQISGAWTRFWLGETLLKSGRKDSRAEAQKLLCQALDITQRFGMKLLEGRIRGLLEGLTAGPDQSEPGDAAHPAYPDGLTDREVEVLRLVARGKTNKEIGFELFISPKTVDTHVQSILRKTGTSNRAEAVAYATRNKLLES